MHREMLLYTEIVKIYYFVLHVLPKNNANYKFDVRRLRFLCLPLCWTITFLTLCVRYVNSGPQIRVRIRIVFSLFLIQNICCGYSKEPSRETVLLSAQNICLN